MGITKHCFLIFFCWAKLQKQFHTHEPEWKLENNKRKKYQKVKKVDWQGSFKFPSLFNSISQLSRGTIWILLYFFFGRLNNKTSGTKNKGCRSCLQSLFSISSIGLWFHQIFLLFPFDSKFLQPKKDQLNLALNESLQQNELWQPKHLKKFNLKKYFNFSVCFTTLLIEKIFY